MTHQMTYGEWLARNPEAAKVPCTECGSVGFFDCGECNGEGVKPCPDCKGEAKGCATCKGSGGAFCQNCEDGELVCQNCDGWGNMSYVMYRDRLRQERKAFAEWAGTAQGARP